MTLLHQSEDLSGRTILGGRFRLLQRLGSGGFGAVYRAEEHALGKPLRTVAVKLTHDRHLREARARERLRDGFTLSRVIASCRNPEARKHLIHVFGFGVAPDVDGRAYMVMEYVSGTPLMKHIASFGSSIPMATARRYLREICTAISACHQLDPPITHGDLKPDNILVDHCRTIRVLDFGLAKPIDHLAGYVPDPSGCLQYTAPETLIGRGYPASDIYSLGLIMYEMLTGRAPHLEAMSSTTRDPASFYYQEKQRLEFKPITELNTSVGPDHHLFGIVERCCRFHPDERYPSVQDVLRNLDEGEPPEAEPGTEVDWRERVERGLRGRDFKGAMAALESADERRGHIYQAYYAMACTGLGRLDEGLAVGAPVYEESRCGSELPAELRERLLHALIECARRSPEPKPDLVDYYESQLGRADRPRRGPRDA